MKSSECFKGQVVKSYLSSSMRQNFLRKLSADKSASFAWIHSFAVLLRRNKKEKVLAYYDEALGCDVYYAIYRDKGSFWVIEHLINDIPFVRYVTDIVGVEYFLAENKAKFLAKLRKEAKEQQKKEKKDEQAD